MSRKRKRPQQNHMHGPGNIAGKQLSRRHFSLGVSGIILAGATGSTYQRDLLPSHADPSTFYFLHSGLPAQTVHRPQEVFAGTAGCAWSPDGQTLALFQERSVTLYDTKTGLKGLCYAHHTDEILTVKWSADSHYLASSGFDSGVHVWEAATGNTVARYQGHSQIVRELAWSPWPTVLASAGYDRTVQIWEALTGTLLVMCSGHEAEIIALAWSPDGRHLTSTDLHNTTMLWHIG